MADLRTTDLADSVWLVLPDDLPLVFRKIEPMLKRVVKPDTGHTVEEVLQELALNYLRLWVIGDFNAIVITRIQHRPSERVLWVEWMVGAKLDEWIADWIEIQAEYARVQGCTAVEFNGRRGYKKYEPMFPNFKAVRTLYRQEL